MAKSKKNFTHQVIFSDGHRILITTPKGWARENKKYFPHTFNDRDVPRTKEIEEQLTNIGFSNTASSEMIVYYKFKD